MAPSARNQKRIVKGSADNANRQHKSGKHAEVKGRKNHTDLLPKHPFNNREINNEEIQDAMSPKSDRGSPDFSSGSENVSMDDEDSDSGEDKSQPYSFLLKSLAVQRQSAEPKRKRRKLDTVQLQQPVIDDNDLDEPADLDSIEHLEQEDSDDLSELETRADPFNDHFSDRRDSIFTQLIEDASNDRWRIEKSPKQTNLSYLSRVPNNSDASMLFPDVQDLDVLHLKERFKSNGHALLNVDSTVIKDMAFPLFNYHDIFFPLRSLDNAKILREVACLHVLNHIFKTRDTVIKNNARIAKPSGADDVELRDQGFTRPKILIVLPTRNSCFQYVECLLRLCRPEQEENKKRFQDSYAAGINHFAETKPVDFQEVFAGNDDDLFRLGLKFTRKTIKYFSQFYNSDIIIASPLGLRMALGTDETKKEDYDFLSSIELVILDQTDAISMQNWEHVEYIFEHLNLQPKEAHGCDFSRVKNWYLDGQAKYLRQTVLISAFNFPSLNKLFTKQMRNISGKVKYFQEEKGAMLDIRMQVRQTFSRFECADPASEPDARFQYFSTAILPSLLKKIKHGGSAPPGILIFVPVYADFVRLRNFFATSSETENISFGSISEYSPVKEVARARSHLMSGRHAVLLYTERAHHFRRYHLKGVKNLIMYGLPENPIFYKEMAGGFLESSMLSGMQSREAIVRALFSKWDVLKLERIVGSIRYTAMIKDRSGDIFDFS